MLIVNIFFLNRICKIMESVQPYPKLKHINCHKCIGIYIFLRTFAQGCLLYWFARIKPKKKKEKKKNLFTHFFNNVLRLKSRDVYRPCLFIYVFFL